jgi:hypothetical protein
MVHASSGKLAINTCLDIRAQYPNGVALNKKVRGLKQFPKAKINRAIYQSNPHLDSFWGGNGIICDKNEIFDEMVASSVVDMTFEGKQITLFVWCYIYQPRLEYGETVGYASLAFRNRCTVRLDNNDPNYYVTVLQDIDSFIVYDHLVTKSLTDPGPPRKAYFQAVQTRVDFKVTPKNSQDQVFNYVNSLNGTKSEIESLYQRIQNGLFPNLYLSLHWKDTNGCFTTAHNYPYENSKVALDCKINLNDWVWD